MSQPFGVELPENIGTPAVEGGGDAGGAPEGAAPQQVSTGTTPTQTPTGTTPAATPPDLDKVEKFLFKGREWTRKEFEDGHLRQQDYTRKMQEVAEARKFADNFAYDLSTVRANRSLMAQFEKIYPKHYVERAKEILAMIPDNSNAAQTPQANPSLKDDPEFQSLRSEIDEWKAAQWEQKVASTQAWIDNTFEKLSKKYPDASPEVVNTRALSASDQGHKIDESVLEKLFRASDKEMKEKIEARYKDKINQQLKAGKEAKDVGTGGDISGGAPKKFRTIKEATQGFLSEITANANR